MKHQSLNTQSYSYPVANTVLMIEPVHFGFNPETAVNNYFQNSGNLNEKIQEVALHEYLNMVEKLRAHGIEVISVRDTENPFTPDSIFPNNWISFHEDGQIILYPMFAPNRRLERRHDIPGILELHGHKCSNIDDFSFWEDENRFLEGTGSMILDRGNKIAYAAISERTDKSLFLQFCSTFGYTPVSFTANQSVGNERKAIYHTNVMLCVADQYAVICAESIDEQDERTMVLETLQKSGKSLIEIKENQMCHFAGNMLQLANNEGVRFLVMSQSAYDVLTESQRERLRAFNEFIICAVPFIENAGGGSVRCMMAEVF